MIYTAITRGDPHFTTLDGKDFTFNGWGEYTLAKIDASGFNFAAQGRTHPLDGTNATQFVAFAFGNIASNVEVCAPQYFLAPLLNRIFLWVTFSKLHRY